MNQNDTSDRARYDALKQELLVALPKKRALDKQLAQTETHLYSLEGAYLTETAMHSGGNIIQGFEHYLKAQGVGRRKNEVSDHDRVFSNSSLTINKSLELMGEIDDGNGTTEEYVKQSTPGGVTTVILPPATRGQELTVAQQNKLLRDKEYQRKKRANARSTGTISDDEVVPTSTSSRRATKRARIEDD